MNYWAKVFLALGLAACFGWSGNVQAQVYSGNIVGYINTRFYTGDNLIANQLLSGNDTLTNLFQYQVPDGSTFTKWDASQNQYLPASTYHTDSGWDINYSLTLGEGGLFHAAAAFTNTFVGSVWPGLKQNFTLPDFGQPAINSSGLYLLSCLIPVGGTNMFYAVVGRDPHNGDSVTTLDPLTQLYSTTTFLNDTWDHGTPGLIVGQSAFFNLVDTIAPAPEPSTLAIIGLGTTAMLLAGRRRKI
jgi:hypothetical protein